ncbi:DUF2975 domain-containing protein [Martelella endophytica]|nr:DUF2975 domain-containing protein [Martelella endophytica]
MKDETKALRNLCNGMSLATRVLQIGVVVMTVSLGWYAITSPEGYADLISPMTTNGKVTITPAITAALVSLDVMTSVLMLAGLQTIWTFFQSLGREKPFSANLAILLRRAGIFALSLWGATWLSDTLSLPLLTAYNPPGEHKFAIGFGSYDFGMLLIVGFLFTMGHAFVLASRIHNELEQVV